jgi:hypothetical protein
MLQARELTDGLPFEVTEEAAPTGNNGDTEKRRSPEIIEVT